MSGCLEALDEKLGLSKPLPSIKDTGKGDKWINVKDGLPELDDKVLAFDKHGFYTVVNYEKFGSGNYFIEQQEHMEIIGVTHWQPLPKPPK